MGNSGQVSATFEGVDSVVAGFEAVIASFVLRAVGAGVRPTLHVAKLGYRRFAEAEAFPMWSRAFAHAPISFPPSPGTTLQPAWYWASAAPLRWQRFDTVDEPVFRRTLLGGKVPKTRRGDDFESRRVPVTRSVRVTHQEAEVDGVHVFRAISFGRRRVEPAVELDVELRLVVRELQECGITTAAQLERQLDQTLSALVSRAGLTHEEQAGTSLKQTA